MNIARILSTIAEERPKETAIIESARGRERKTSFGELEIAARCAAAMLAADGLRAGDHALILQPMSAQLYVALLAVFRLGAIAMVLDPSAGPKHVERCCTIQPPKALIASKRAHWLRLWISGLRKIPLKYSIGGRFLFTRRWERFLKFHPNASMHACDLDTPALLTFTSGSTAQPKAAVRSHGLLLAQRTALKEALNLEPGQGDLTTLPIFLLANLASGVCSIIPCADLRKVGQIDPVPVVRQIETGQPQSTVASPAFLERLADHCITNRIILWSFQRIFTGGAPVFPKLMRKLKQMAPQSQIIAVYGSTEAEPIAHIGFDEMTDADFAAMQNGKGLFAGVPVPQINLKILRQQWGRPIADYSESNFAKDCQPANQPGEIVVHGDHVLRGYLNGIGDQETKFRVGSRVWHRTGDAGYLDDRGRLWLLGRCEARIEDNRGELYPFAVECAAQEHPAVRRAALVAVGGQRILAIECSEEMNMAELQKSLAWAQLDSIRNLKDIPVDKRHNAKVDYPELRRLMER
ncbi:MAG TPA: AMP-binding protein [Tepidisphaeraceae bacterium]|jgi:acyl-CoA synthetase (AMP-forming)/AMP-acid ligase II|nr:AMP-binding protein [Tepidisphaeraceae bacterium]